MEPSGHFARGSLLLRICRQRSVVPATNVCALQYPTTKIVLVLNVYVLIVVAMMDV